MPSIGQNTTQYKQATGR